MLELFVILKTIQAWTLLLLLIQLKFSIFITQAENTFQGHSKKRTCFVTTNTKFILKLLTEVSASKGHSIPRNKSPKKSKIWHQQPPFWNKSSATRPLCVTSCGTWIRREAWSAVGSVARFQAFLVCFVLSAKIPECFAPGCSNRSEKDPEKRLSFHRLPYRNKKLAKKWLSTARFKQNIENSSFRQWYKKSVRVKTKKENKNKNS